MAKGDVITAEDIMPRHVRMSGELPSPMTVPAGASLADTRRQLVLRTFASTSGDAVRTAKIVGISPDEVRAEISALVRTNGGSHADDGDSAPDDKLKAAKATSARPKPKKK
jgi:hypothetical protein